MKIKTMLQVVSIISFVILLAFAVFTYRTVKEIRTSSDEMILTDEMVREIIKTRKLTYEYLLYHSDETRKEWWAQYDFVSRLLKSSSFCDPREKAVVEDIIVVHEDIGNAFLQMLSNYETIRDRGEINGGTKERDNKLMDTVLELSHKKIALVYKLKDSVHEKMFSVHKKEMLINISFFATLVFFIIFNLWVFSCRIVRPVLNLYSGAEIIGSGNLEHRIASAAKDEIGGLSRAFDRMAENLQKITASKEALEKAEKTARESEAKYKKLVETLPQKIFLKDKNSNFISVNENFSCDLGLKPEDMVGKKGYEWWPKELMEKYIADDKRVMESGKTEDIEETYVQKGVERMVHTVKTPVRDDNGNVSSILGIFWDVTEEVAMKKALQEKVNELERFRKATINRELRMEEMRKEMEKLKASK